jgi:hypothetical protein
VSIDIIDMTPMNPHHQPARSVLLLDASYQPVMALTCQQMLVLLSKDRIVFPSEEIERAVLDGVATRRFAGRPVIVKLTRTLNIPPRIVRPTRSTLLIRDRATCQYCAGQPPLRELTVDHVIPTSRGGARHTWENQVIACKRCNHRKGHRLLAEAGMRLRSTPGPLRENWQTILLLRHPQLRDAYRELISA